MTAAPHMAEALKPCPFCGGEAEAISLFAKPHPGNTYVKCKVCSAATERGSYDWAVSAWNRRAPDEKDAEIARLREALADQWRPIETAPKDDTAILVWDGELTIAWWIDGEWMPCIPDSPPTHWRPSHRHPTPPDPPAHGPQPPNPQETDMPALPPSFPTIRYSAFDRLVARINRPTLPPVLDAEFDGLAWTVPAHVADRANAQRQVS